MAYGFSRSITVDKTLVPNTDQLDFPALFGGSAGPYTYLKTVANGGKIQNTVSFNGQTVPADLKFTSDSDGNTLLSWEVASYDPATGDIEVWVKIPTLTTATDFVFYIFYGDASVSTYQGGAAGAAWSSGHLIVWHLPDGSTLAAKDSTSNANDGTVVGAGTIAAAGKIDGSVDFSGSSTYISYPDATALRLTAAFTFDFWAKPSSQTNKYLFSKGNNDYNILYGFSSANFELYAQGFSGSDPRTSSQIHVVPDGNWHHVVYTYDGSLLRGYLDGTLAVNRSVGFSFRTTSSTGRLGASDGGDYFIGGVDEFHIENVSRSADWIVTRYNNQNSPSTFYTLGSEVPASTPTPDPISSGTFPLLSSGSMTVHGALLNEAMAMYPITLSHGYVTRVIKFLGDQEQRWVVRGKLFSGTLEFNKIGGYDLSILVAFFRSRLGGYVNPSLTSTFDITIDGVNYQYCAFDQDDITPTAQTGETYSVLLKIKQLRPND